MVPLHFNYFFNLKLFNTFRYSWKVFVTLVDLSICLFHLTSLPCSSFHKYAWIFIKLIYVVGNHYMRCYRKIPGLDGKTSFEWTYLILAAILFKIVILWTYTAILIMFSTSQKHSSSHSLESFEGLPAILGEFWTQLQNIVLSVSILGIM